MIELFRRRRLERVHVATLRVDAGHHVLDRAVLAGGVHRLEDQQHRPAILRVEPFLQAGHSLAALLEHLVGDRLEALAPRIAGIDVLEAEARAIGDAVPAGEFGRGRDDHTDRILAQAVSLRRIVRVAYASAASMITRPTPYAV